MSNSAVSSQHKESSWKQLFPKHADKDRAVGKLHQNFLFMKGGNIVFSYNDQKDTDRYVYI